MTSEELARYLGTHAVVVRRTLAGLRDLGYVASAKGPGGGWAIACDLKAVTLQDVYTAVGSPPLFGMGNRSEHPECLVEQVVNSALDDAFVTAQALIVERFSSITLADLAADFGRRFAPLRAGATCAR